MRLSTDFKRFKIEILKICNGIPALSMSCKPSESFLLQIYVPRELGSTNIELLTSTTKHSFIWKSFEEGFDIYELDFSFLLKNAKKHIEFKISIKSNDEYYYPSSPPLKVSENKIIYNLTDNNSESENFLFTLANHTNSHLFKGAVYHIFIDRFNKISPTIRKDSKYNDDWENGIPEYAQKPGDHLENNTHFGGNFEGIENKLDYLEALSVECIYLSPINKAYSNHKYDVGSYFDIDENFGGEEKLIKLIEACHKRGIKVIFDSVFNHTGERSKYFNKFGTYNSIGAYQSKDSEFYDWYSFSSHPNDYNSWWGIKCLPAIKKGNKSFIDYICKEGGVIDYYMSLGADGLRLDVADELPLLFIEEIKRAVTRNNKRGIVIGEVWENAARKIAYDEKKFYFDTGKLDSVTNYPLMNAILEYVKNGNLALMQTTLAQIYSDYPTETAIRLFNIISTHDTWRAISFLGADAPHEKNSRAIYKMPTNLYKKAIERLKLASALQVFLPGIPCIYYGDEIGMEGLEDPFNRMPMRWHNISEELLKWYRAILKIRKENHPLWEGGFEVKYSNEKIFVFDRLKDHERIRCIFNLSGNKLEIKSNKGVNLITNRLEDDICINSNEFKIIRL